VQFDIDLPNWNALNFRNLTEFPISYVLENRNGNRAQVANEGEPVRYTLIGIFVYLFVEKRASGVLKGPRSKYVSSTTMLAAVDGSLGTFNSELIKSSQLTARISKSAIRL